MQQKTDDRRFAETVADFVATHRLEGFIHIGEGRPDAMLGNAGDCFYSASDSRFYAFKSAKNGWGVGAYVKNDRQIFDRMKTAVLRQQATGER